VLLGDNCGMNRSTSLYKRYRVPSEIIPYAVWLYPRFNLSHRDIEDLLAERGITVSYEYDAYVVCKSAFNFKGVQG